MVAEYNEEEILEEAKEESPEARWVSTMVRSARRYHKLCPYYDKKTRQCLLMVTVEGTTGRCDRDGRFENCPVFAKFLKKAYKYYTSTGKVLPRDFQDVVNQAYLF